MNNAIIKKIIEITLLLTIKIEVAKVEDPVTKENFTQVTVKYGFFGNLPESQKIVSKITSNLR